MIADTQNTTKNELDRLPSTFCSGYRDVNGNWHNGFLCLIENSVQYFCCGTDIYRYCCSPNQYSFETQFSINSNYALNYRRTYNNDNNLTDEQNLLLISNRKLIKKQFEQFQRYFLPTFLLTTTILFLFGIALWFWLYKHKQFYSIGENDFDQAISLDQTQQNDHGSIFQDRQLRKYSNSLNNV